MLIVSHEMAFVREVSTQVVMMDKGQVVEVGPPAEIFDSPKASAHQGVRRQDPAALNAECLGRSRAAN